MLRALSSSLCLFPEQYQILPAISTNFISPTLRREAHCTCRSSQVKINPPSELELLLAIPLFRKPNTSLGSVGTKSFEIHQVMENLSGVVCCKTCSVRVAFEKDINEIVRNENSELANLLCPRINTKVFAAAVTCSRCGREHYQAEGPNALENTLLLRSVDSSTFDRTPLRVLTFVVAHTDEFFEEQTYTENEREKSRSVFTPNKGGVQALGQISQILPGRSGNIEVSERRVLIARTSFRRWLGREMKSKLEEEVRRHDSTLADCYEWYDGAEAAEGDQIRAIFAATYDLVLIFVLHSGGKLDWSGYENDDTEEWLVHGWTSTGGNVLFGNYGVPNNVSQFSRGTDIDLELVASEFRAVRKEERQEAFSELVKKDKYLGWWPSVAPFPQRVIERIEKAFVHGMYEDWKFRRSFPQITFQQPLRRWYGLSPALSIKDQFLPTRGGSSQKTKRSSRKLFEAGLDFFRRLDAQSRWNKEV